MLDLIKIEKLIAIAKEAGEAILKIYKSDFDIETKQDHSPLTEADKQSNQIIINRLLKAYPDIPFISEETKQTPFEKRKNWTHFWLIDPLDGTKEFINRNGEFTVNIALIENRTPVLGIIYVPVFDVLYYAQKGKGSFKIETDGTHHRMETVKHMRNDKLTVVGSRSHANEALQQFVEELKGKYRQVDFISSGSSLKFCRVAEGKADIYPRTGPTYEWDTAAGHAIVLESGKSVYDFQSGEPLIYNKENLLNGWFIVR